MTTTNGASMTATVVVDGRHITGTVYHVRDNGWLCVETSTGRVASGPSPAASPARSIRSFILMDESDRANHALYSL